MSNFYKPELNKKLDIQKEKPSSYVGEDIIDSVDYALKVERLKENRTVATLCGLARKIANISTETGTGKGLLCYAGRAFFFV